MNPHKIGLSVLISVLLCAGVSAVAVQQPDIEIKLSKLDESRLTAISQEFLSKPMKEKRIFYPDDFSFTLNDLLNHFQIGLNIQQFSRNALAREILQRLPDVEKIREESDVRALLRFVAEVVVMSNDTLVSSFAVFMKNPEVPSHLRAAALMELWEVAQVDRFRLPPVQGRDRMRQFEIIRDKFVSNRDATPEDQALIRKSCEDLIRGGRT